MLIETIMKYQGYTLLLLIGILGFHVTHQDSVDSKEIEDSLKRYKKDFRQWMKDKGMSPQERKALKKKLKEIEILANAKYGLTPISPDALDKDNMMYDGDILLSLEQATMIEETLKSSKHRNRPKRKVIPFKIFKQSKWTFPIKYKFNYMPENGGERWKAAIRKAIYKWENTTCVRFKELSVGDDDPKSPFISFTNLDPQCFSYIGRQRITIPQPVNFAESCIEQPGTLEHEIGHALGFWHEQARPDRDHFVRINTGNIEAMKENNFLKVPDIQSEAYGVEYDYSSVMHYHGKAFSKNEGITIKALDDLYQSSMGQRTGLSFADIKTANTAYCGLVCRPLPVGKSCKWGGYVDPNNCQQCVCPDGFGGRYCNGVESGIPAECSGFLHATADVQTITSPNYPIHYQDFQHCNWRIIAPKGCKIVLRFVDDFNVYCLRDVCYHWVEIKYNKELGLAGPRFCCELDKNPKPMISEDNEAVVLFRSDYASGQTRRKGFKLEYTLNLPDPACEAALGMTTTSTTTTTTTTSAPTLPDMSTHMDETITPFETPTTMSTSERTPSTKPREKPTPSPPEDGPPCGGCTGSPNSIQPKCVAKIESKCRQPNGQKIPCIKEKASCCENVIEFNSTHCQAPTCEEWDPWSICTKECGACGTQVRYRKCSYRGPWKDFLRKEVRVCNTQVCGPDCTEKFRCFFRIPWSPLCERRCKPCCKKYTGVNGQCVLKAGDDPIIMQLESPLLMSESDDIIPSVDDDDLVLTPLEKENLGEIYSNRRQTQRR
ncbi:unnamed protein product [Owenia fusiformis]|uniref:Metalloendopeptidase n=1 Tax=Owenia fusiformis TaxID=6347 RepID=A0A8S4N1B9_OWEFU|nr:unnamed protein product [Owenia fusiformis]